MIVRAAGGGVGAVDLPVNQYLRINADGDAGAAGDETGAAGDTGGTTEAPQTTTAADGTSTSTDTPEDISDILMHANADDSENYTYASSFVALSFLPLLALAHYYSLV